MSAPDFRPEESFARALDEQDPLRSCRDLFHIPQSPKDRSRPAVYMTGNSLGCLPKATRGLLEQELEDWARLGVDAHISGRDPWLPYHEWFREPVARLVGAVPGECVMMNSLTANLHFLMVSFFRPTPDRFKIVIEDSAFPSDSYAVVSQLKFHGIDPAQGLVRLKPRSGEFTLRTDDIVTYLRDQGRQVALVLLGAVNYLTGQWFDMPAITAAAKEQGCTVGWDLAHAAGNVPMKLHDWGVDWAAWCTYKYLNSGPGSPGGAFVHERHARNFDLPRFAGWWGNDPATRFQMKPGFVAREGADGWQVSNPPIFSLAPVKASMQIFDRVGMGAIREKSLKLTGYLEWLLGRECPGIEIVTPRDPGARGAQLSLAIKGSAREIEQRLHDEGVFVDVREPNIVRAAPAPLYNSFHDVWEFAAALKKCLAGSRP